METRSPAIKEVQAVEPQYPTWRSLVFWLLAGGFISLIFAASWADDSRMTELRWIPDWLAAWADKDPNIRSAVPFVPLAFLLFRGFEGNSFKRPFLGTFTLGGACLGLSEFGQIFLPHRTADLRDLMWGGSGIAIGTALGWLSTCWKKFKDRKR